ncbi:MAG TPA: hypothetical protein VGJ28_11645 [Micromonosporaceae bacterium]|jgi:hypothetical protein
MPRAAAAQPSGSKLADSGCRSRISRGSGNGAVAATERVRALTDKATSKP